MLQNLIDEINVSTTDSNIAVLNALCDSYDKAYTIVESYDGSDIGAFNIFQESKTTDVPTDKKKKNILVSILQAISGFFKTIVNSIKSFFSKNKDNTVKRLNKLTDIDEETASIVQEKLEDPSSSACKKCKDIEDKNEKFAKENIDESVVEKSDKKEKDESSVVINVKTKTMRTRIIFDNWKEFLNESNEYIDSVVGEMQQFGGKRDNAIVNRPTRSLKGRTFRVLNESRNMRGSIFTPRKKKKYHLFKMFPHKMAINEIVDNVNEMHGMFKDVSDKASKAAKSFEDVCNVLDSEITNSDDFIFNKHFASLYDDVRLIRNEFGIIYQIVSKLTLYMSSELKMYGDLLDIVEPIIAEAKKKGRNEQHVVVHRADD